MAHVALRQEQQKDNLCGPFCAARILRVEQDLVALRAGTTLPPAAGEPSVPRGAQSRTDYDYDLPRSPAAESGTSAAGLVRAIEALSEGRLACVPVCGEWTPERVAALVDGAPGLDARLIANIRTGKLWGSRPSAEQVLTELRGTTADGPPPDWDVGHFIELEMLVRGEGGALIAVHDTYPCLGLDGHHLQPARAIAAALARGDGHEGGVLVVAPVETKTAAAGFVRGIGLEVGLWNNGSRSDADGSR